MGAKETKFKVVNKTSCDITHIDVWSVDGFDWKGARPDSKFSGKRVKANSYIEEKLIINLQASICPFNMRLNFADGTKDAFRINQKHAIGESANFSHFEIAHNVEFGKNGHTVIVTVTETADQAIDGRIKRIREDAINLSHNGQHEEAIKKIDAAILIAKPSISSSLKDDKYTILDKFVGVLIEKGFRSEQERKFTDEQINFTEAKKHLSEALSIHTSKESNAILMALEHKVKGNAHYITALSLQNDAVKQSAIENEENLNKSKEKYVESLTELKSAENEYKQIVIPDQRFTRMFSTIVESIAFTENTIKTIDAKIEEASVFNLDVRFGNNN